MISCQLGKCIWSSYYKVILRNPIPPVRAASPNCSICKGSSDFLRQWAGARRAPESQESQGIIRVFAFGGAKICPCAPRAEMQNPQGFIRLFVKIGRRAPRARITRITRNYKGFRILQRKEFPCARHEPKCRICKDL